MPDRSDTQLRPLAVAPFGQWDYADVQKALKDNLPPDYSIKKGYAVDKDHFQKGKEWVGPGSGTSNDQIAKQFAPDDAVGEVLSNVENAFSEPQLGGAPLEELPQGRAVPEDVESKIQEALALLSDWWDKQRLQEHIQDRQRTAAWAGYGGLRLWIPWRFLRQAGDQVVIKPTNDLAKALSYIHIDAPMPDVGAVLEDSGTKDKVAVFMDEEVEWVDGEKKTYKRAELTYLDPEREDDESADTIMRTVYSDPKKPDIVTRLRLGGRMMAAQMTARALLTEPVLRTQRQLNLLTTLVTRMAETAAFRERYIKNAKPQGLRVLYTEGDDLQNGAFLERDEEGREWQVVPQPRTLGASTTTELIGLPAYDDMGNAKGNQMPDVLIVDPVDPGPYVLAADATRRRVLRMCSQGHLGGISNAEASGIAYEQARAVFEKDLNKRRTSEEGMLRDLLTAVLALVEQITGKEGYFTNSIRITVDQHVNAGPRSPDLVRLDLESYEAGVLSRATTMAKVGVEDVEAEEARVRESAVYILGILEKATAASKSFTPESLLAVLSHLNVPKEVIASLVPVSEPEPMNEPPVTDNE